MSRKHSVLLREDLCVGCTNCVQNCPTKAIRVHQGKATIKDELCIDCAECIRTCAHHAKYSRTHQLRELKDYQYPVVLVPPSFYGQFTRIKPEEVVAGLYKLGFQEVFDVALAAEALSLKTIDFLAENEGSYISSSCPVVVRLIRLLYPELIEYLIPFKSPVELMAEVVRQKLLDRGFTEEEMGIFFITPCPAKVTTISDPLGVKKSYLDKAIAVEEVYQELLAKIDEIKKRKPPKEAYPAPYLGYGWGRSGGEAEILKLKQQRQVLSASGIHNVKNILEELSRNNISGIRYFELAACNQGCVGGVLNVKNPYQARYDLRQLIAENQQMVEQDLAAYNYGLEKEYQAVEVGQLDNDLSKAMAKLSQLEKEKAILPGLDCAACGAPDCETLAEDIVTGKAQRTDCIFVLRKKVEELADKMSSLAHALPPVMSYKRKDDKHEA